MIRLLSYSLPALALALTPPSSAADWPRFRGPNGTGVADGPLPEIDPKKPLWKVQLPGKGNGSPIVVGGKVYLQSSSADGKSRALVCVNAADGNIDWAKEVAAEKGATHPKNSMASGTPACDGRRIYCQWWDGSGVSLRAHDLSGKELWSASLGGYVSQHGPGFSPMVHGGLVFVNVDDDEHAELVALDAGTGEKKWVAPRKHYRASYSTPFVVERPGKPAELILGTTMAVTSYDPAGGKVNWEYPIAWPGKQMPLRVVGCPLHVAGLFVIYFGDGGGSRYMAAIDPSGKKPAKAWDLKRETPYVPCVLAKGDKLFWIGDKGLATCAEARTGKQVWAEKVFEGSDVTASPVLVGDRILLVSEKGEVAAVKAGAEFEELARAPLGEKVYASPAVADGRVFIRGEKHLFCFGKK
jgi:outer membrane protein assembly factor BamB